jgi:hypothetical protein
MCSELGCKKLELHVVIAAELMIGVVGCRWPRGFASRALGMLHRIAASMRRHTDESALGGPQS